MLTPMQQSLLKQAAKEAKGNNIKPVDDMIALIRRQSPEKFFTLDPKKPDPALRNRKFFDQPFSLMPHDYAGHEVEFLGNAQQSRFNARSKKLLRK